MKLCNPVKPCHLLLRTTLLPSQEDSNYNTGFLVASTKKGKKKSNCSTLPYDLARNLRGNGIMEDLSGHFSSPWRYI